MGFSRLRGRPLAGIQSGLPDDSNKSSGTTAFRRARRRYLVQLLGADPREIIWTSGATGGNNLAIKGAAQFDRAAASSDRSPRAHGRA
jgi:cysteine desulfurase